ncbi:LysE family translocator [Paenibacillus woosongensis]|uniref:LysE family translocator n=1 Tax=Paenibacillus woosongensis TaxID=307580 RepID=A0A7X3CPM4_9BACL|nr:LysE family transporter [Paenibacillus woosongensis]MUG46185.1 LysE family translocator [Paenibacillus woosongensis]
MNMTSFLIYCVIVTFTPGPTNILILAAVNHYGTRKTIKYIAGASLAFFLLVAASVILNHVLAASLPPFLSVVRVVGSIFMLYLAYQIYRMDVSKESAGQAITFASGFAMQFANPKVVLFTLTVIPAYVMPYYTSRLMLSIFVVIVSLIGLAAYVTWAVFGTLFRKFMQKYQKAANIITALFLVYSAFLVSGIAEFAKG